MPIKRLLLAVSLLSCTFVVATTPTHALAEPTYIIDPSLSALEQADAATIRNAITKAANEYGYTGFTAVIYAPTLNGANWAFNELAKISCPLGSVENLASGTAIADLSLGRCIVFKATPISYPNVAKNAESVAYHEVFHLAQAIRGGLKPMGARIDDMRWIYEGTAEIGGYQPQLSSGKLTQSSLIALLRDSAMNTSSSLTQISNAWVDHCPRQHAISANQRNVFTLVSCGPLSHHDHIKREGDEGLFRRGRSTRRPCRCVHFNVRYDRQ
jgi:hypothetical protein